MILWGTGSSDLYVFTISTLFSVLKWASISPGTEWEVNDHNLFEHVSYTDSRSLSIRMKFPLAQLRTICHLALRWGPTISIGLLGHGMFLPAWSIRFLQMPRGATTCTCFLQMENAMAHAPKTPTHLSKAMVGEIKALYSLLQSTPQFVARYWFMISSDNGNLKTGGNYSKWYQFRNNWYQFHQTICWTAQDRTARSHSLNVKLGALGAVWSVENVWSVETGILGRSVGTMSHNRRC
jgi:hypothetical protein